MCFRPDTIYLTEDEYISGVEGRSGTLVDQLTFHTNKGRTFGPYGGTGGNAFNFDLPKDARLVGFYGRSGQAIDQIGLVYATKDANFGKRANATVRDHRTKKN